MKTTLILLLLAAVPASADMYLCSGWSDNRTTFNPDRDNVTLNFRFGELWGAGSSYDGIPLPDGTPLRLEDKLQADQRLFSPSLLFTKPMTARTTLLLGVEYVQNSTHLIGQRTALHYDGHGTITNLGIRIYLDK